MQPIVTRDESASVSADVLDLTSVTDDGSTSTQSHSPRVIVNTDGTLTMIPSLEDVLWPTLGTMAITLAFGSIDASPRLADEVRPSMACYASLIRPETNSKTTRSTDEVYTEIAIRMLKGVPRPLSPDEQRLVALEEQTDRLQKHLMSLLQQEHADPLRVSALQTEVGRALEAEADLALTLLEQRLPALAEAQALNEKTRELLERHEEDSSSDSSSA